MERPEEWSGVSPASVLTDHSGQVVLHSLQYVERCSRRAVEYCVAVVQPGRDDATYLRFATDQSVHGVLISLITLHDNIENVVIDYKIIHIQSSHNHY